MAYIPHFGEVPDCVIAGQVRGQCDHCQIIDYSGAVALERCGNRCGWCGRGRLDPINAAGERCTLDEATVQDSGFQSSR